MKRICTLMYSRPSLLTVRAIAEGEYEISIADNIIAAKTILDPENKQKEADVYRYTRYNGVVRAKTRESFIAEAVHIRYSIDDEIALLNKGIVDSDNEEYLTYRSLVDAIKKEADKYFER